MSVTLLEGDCREIIPTLTQKFQCVFSDPPYGVKWSRKNLNYNIASRIENFIPGYCEVKKEEYAQFSIEWIGALKQVIDKTAPIYTMTGWNNKRHILNAIDALKFKQWGEIIWQYNFGVYKKSNYIDAHQTILYYSLKKPKFYDFCRFSTHKDSYHDRENVWHINRVQRKRGEPKTAPMAPEELIEKCLMYSTLPGDWVLDPFAGTGTVAAVCKRIGRNCVCIEKNPNFIPHIKARLGISNQ